MSTITSLRAREAHPDRDAESRKRANRLNRATTQEMHAAIKFLSMTDPDAFEIAFPAVPVSQDAFPDLDDLESEVEWRLPGEAPGDL